MTARLTCLWVDERVEDGRDEEDARVHAHVIVLGGQLDAELEDAVGVHGLAHEDHAVPQPDVLGARHHVHACSKHHPPQRSRRTPSAPSGHAAAAA